MKITEVQLIPIKANDGLIAFGSLVIDGNIFLGSIGIHRRLDGSGYRLTYPTKKIGEKNFNIYHPINKEASEQIEQAIFKKIETLFE